MSKELIAKIRDELSDGGVFAAPYLAELLKDSAQALEAQAREIERLESDRNRWESLAQKAWDSADKELTAGVIRELAALKAQPNGVVLYTCIGKGGQYEYVGLSAGAGLSKGEQRQVYRCTSTGRVFHRECMDFSARMERLNQPASAGDERAAFEAAFPHLHHRRYIDGVDQYESDFENGAWLGWQKARAALSANHSERVRKGLGIQVCKLGRLGAAYDPADTRYAYTYAEQPDNAHAWRLGEAFSATKPGGDCIDAGLGLLKQLEKRGFGVFQLAAAPSAGSQGGDV